MNPQQEKGCKVILNKLSTDVLESLCDTVTKKQVKTNSRAGIKSRNDCTG